MSPTGKAGKPRAKPPNLKGKTQFQRFVETAKALEVDETGAAFERAIYVVLGGGSTEKPTEPLTAIRTPTTVANEVKKRTKS